MTGRHPLATLALVIGLFGQVGFFADLGREAMPVWVRIVAHMALLVPLVFVDPPERAPRPALGVLAAAAALYVGLTVASFLLVLGDVTIPGAGLFLVLEVPGSLVAAGSLSRAWRLVRPPPPPAPERIYEAPWSGAYRTRPAVPPAPPPAPSVELRPRVRWDLYGYTAICAVFVAGGVLMARWPRHGNDRFFGLLDVVFFGLGLWIFAGEIAAGRSRTDPQVRARRTQLVLAIAGLETVIIALAEDGAQRGHRIAAALFGVFLVGLLALGRRGAAVTRPRPAPGNERRPGGCAARRRGPPRPG